MAQRVRLRRGFQFRLRRSGFSCRRGNFARESFVVAHAIQTGLRVASAGDEIHRAILAEFEVGQIERLAFEEHLGFGGEARAVRLQMHGKNPAVRPVHRKERLLVFFWEIAFRAEFHTRRRTEADVHRRGQAVRIIIWPFPRARAPAVFAAGHAMNDAGRPIPRRAPVPFHVAVECEYFPRRTEIKIIRVAKAAQHQFPFFSFRIRPQNVAARRDNSHRVAVRIPQARQQQVFLKIFVRRIGGQPFRQFGVVPVHDVNHAVRPGHDAVITMLAFPGKFFQEVNLVGLEPVIVIGVNQTIQPRAAGAVPVHIQAVVRPAHSHRLVQRHRNGLNFLHLSGAVERHPQQRLVIPLRRDNQPALGVNRHGNPRTFIRLRRAQELRFEARQQRQFFRRRGLVGAGDIRPGRSSVRRK